MSFVRTHSWPVLIVALVSLIAACFSTFYMILAVGVSDGAGYLTALIMLAGSALAGLGALVLVGISARAILADL